MANTVFLCALSLLAASGLAADQVPDLPGDSPPVVIRQARPQYPKAAYEQRIEGTVMIEFDINAKGKVTAISIVESVPALDAAALKCAKKWRFKPATRDGVPVATMATLPIVFRLHPRADDSETR